MADLDREARQVRERIETLTKSPAALLLPEPVRAAIRDLARLVESLAVEVVSDAASVPVRQGDGER